MQKPDYTTKCKQCNKTIVPIGTSRKNGRKDIIDWDRHNHLKCLIKLTNEEYRKFCLEHQHFGY
jgi:hypothetical protein